MSLYLLAAPRTGAPTLPQPRGTPLCLPPWTPATPAAKEAKEAVEAPHLSVLHDL
jgi:hypothetical protein